MIMFSSSREWRNWQTHWLQVPVLERAWGFKSPLAHANRKALLAEGLSSSVVACAALRRRRRPRGAMSCAR
jgi:hypothetical protein